MDGITVRHTREKYELSRQDVANILEVDQSTVAKMEARELTEEEEIVLLTAIGGVAALKRFTLLATNSLRKSAA